MVAAFAFFERRAKVGNGFVFAVLAWPFRSPRESRQCFFHSLCLLGLLERPLKSMQCFFSCLLRLFARRTKVCNAARWGAITARIFLNVSKHTHTDTQHLHTALVICCYSFLSLSFLFITINSICLFCFKNETTTTGA